MVVVSMIVLHFYENYSLSSFFGGRRPNIMY